jgi:hypothetical protein
LNERERKSKEVKRERKKGGDAERKNKEGKE